MAPRLDRRSEDVFREALQALAAEGLPHLVGGAFALHSYTGQWRFTKDLDLFCERHVGERALDVLRGRGFRTYVEEKHWLGKAVKDEALLDLIWGGGNWVTFVDPSWIARARAGRLVGLPVLLVAPEDLILSKAYVAGRERFDGTDIAHLIHACGRDFDWDDLTARFGDHWPLLLHYVILFRFVYPREREIVPARVVRALAAQIGTDAELRDGLAFRGPLLDRYGYLSDLSAGGRPDPREVLAHRAGLPVADVRLRRLLDTQALEAGLPYRVTDSGKLSSLPEEEGDGMPEACVGGAPPETG